MTSVVAALGMSKAFKRYPSAATAASFSSQTSLLAVILRAFVSAVSSRTCGSAAVLFPVKHGICPAEGQTALETSLFLTYLSDTTEDELVQLQPFYPQPDFDHFFLTDPRCIHRATSKRGSSSITSRASSEPSKLVSPDLSNAKRWVERSLSLVGSDAAALVANWLCTLSVIDLGGHSSRQWLQGKAQLALLEALLGKLPKVSFCILDLCSG